MKSKINPILGLIILTIFLLSCEEEVNKIPPPARVVLVQKTAENAENEHGIDAEYDQSRPDTNAIHLEWHPNTGGNLAGYMIYRSLVDTVNYSMIGKIEKSFEEADTFFVDNSASTDIRYYYYVRAFDDQDQVGEPSDTVSYKLIGRPILLGVQLNDSSPNFQWSYSGGFAPGEFVFRLRRRIGENIFQNVKIVRETSTYNLPENWELSDFGMNTPLTSGVYQWRIDAIGDEDNSGSESNWGQFVVQ